MASLANFKEFTRALALEEGKRYIIFVDPSAIDITALAEVQDEEEFTNDILFVCVRPAPGQTVTDSVAAFELAPLEQA